MGDIGPEGAHLAAHKAARHRPQARGIKGAEVDNIRAHGQSSLASSSLASCGFHKNVAFILAQAR
jgi:hypothetical protein